MAPSAIQDTTTTLPISSKAQIEVPPGLKLIPAEKLDLRSDEEIGAWLQERHEVTSDQNIWAFWDKGYTKLPPWVQRNVINWVRRLGNTWTVHLLDRVPGSATNISEFVDSSFFPDAFNNNKMDGSHVGPHSGDLLRLPLLWLYGGIWMDVGTFLFRHVDDICWNAISDPSTPYELGGFALEIRPGWNTLMNGFIASKRGNPFIKRWHAIYVALWDGVTNSTGFHAHPLIKHLPLLSVAAENLNLPTFNTKMEAFSDYLGQHMCFERLCKLIDPTDGFNGPEYYSTKIFLVPGMQETFYFNAVTNWSGNVSSSS